MIGAAAATLAVWAVADPLAGIALTVHSSSGASVQEVGPVAVALVSVLAGLAGWALLAVLERVTARVRPIWIVLALVVLLLSFAGPLSAVTTAAKVVLAGMHLEPVMNFASSRYTNEYEHQTQALPLRCQ